MRKMRFPARKTRFKNWPLNLYPEKPIVRQRVWADDPSALRLFSACHYGIRSSRQQHHPPTLGCCRKQCRNAGQHRDRHRGGKDATIPNYAPPHRASHPSNRLRGRRIWPHQAGAAPGRVNQECNASPALGPLPAVPRPSGALAMLLSVRAHSAAFPPAS